MDTKTKSDLQQIAVIGGFLPRQCGIATFTTDLCESLAAKFPTKQFFAVPVTDSVDGYDYPARVRFEFKERDLDSYASAADFLNLNDVDIVCVQHEYGIFGGSAGSYLLALLRDLRMPVVTTLHTILQTPNPDQLQVMKELGRLSDRFVVMTNKGKQFLEEIYKIPPEKIDLIPHGIPDVPFVDSSFFKDKLGVEGRFVLLSFGLLSPNKGIENVIEALPAIIARYPNVVYVVVGATHPHVRQSEGETYRLYLEQLTQDLGVAHCVIFHNRFVSINELLEFIGAADIYITPYLNPAQIVSGTLAYTVGAGKAVISTPYWHAEELLAEGRGLLVPFKDPQAIADQVLHLLTNETERHAMRKLAYLHARNMIWPTVAQQYMDSFERSRDERLQKPRAMFAPPTLDRRPRALPDINLDHIHRMTDDIGILQHAIITVPSYSEGYTTDDNARALGLTAMIEQFGEIRLAEAQALMSRYLGFLWYAYNSKTGRFRNYLPFDRRWVEDAGSEDSHGRALWGLGCLLGHSNNLGLRGSASRLFQLALPAAMDLKSPRAWAFTITSLNEYLRQFQGDRTATTVRDTLVLRLMDSYLAVNTPDWPWFEDSLSYCNAHLPCALLLGGESLGKREMTEAALKSLEWLVGIQRPDGRHFVPIGSNGFYPRDATRARFDQQPIEAYATLSACLEAYRITGEERWQKEARRTFDWFFGHNDLRLPLYDAATGGCRDGLHSDRVNQNEGAESTLAFLLSLLEWRLSENLINERKSNNGYHRT